MESSGEWRCFLRLFVVPERPDISSLPPKGRGNMTTETTGVTRAEFQRLSREYRYIPLWVSFNADLETPVTLFRKLTGEGCGYLLESVEHGRVLGRYSFAGAEPLAYFTSSLPGGPAVPDQPLAALQQWLAGFRTAPVARRGELPPFYGGAVGYFAYDLVRDYEQLPRQAVDDYGLPAMTMMVTRYTLLLDHLRHTATLVYLAEAGDEQAYQAARDKLYRCLARLKGPDNGLGVGRPEPEAGTRDEPVTFDRAGFCRAVEKCREYIAAGEVFQVVLSQRFSVPLRACPFDVYRALRSLNPSPYLFYLNLPGVCLAGASPEALVRVNGGRVETHPIAGTRPRGKDPAEDRLLAAELLDDDKERAEHVMLV
ncbi:MAG: chorismate-binding protein, partial [Heliobacteriaceae bacterium]|nr:chorismate-binding protein [Heliobacteriaceae bacterium]